MNTTLPLKDHPSDRLQRIEQTLRTRYHCWKLYSSADGPSNLGALLRERLPEISAESWQARFDFGGIYINGREALTDQPLPFPCKVEYYEPKFPIAEASSIFPPFHERLIIFSDEHIAVVYKPPRLSSMPAKEQRHYSLKLYLDRHFGSPIHMPSRLDVSAQGLVIVSRAPTAHRGLQHAFEQRTVKKTYSFATRKIAGFSEYIVDRRIALDPLHPVLRTTSTTDGQHASTVLSFSHHDHSEGHEISVVHAQPISGRTHQIRVHAASQGMSIIGDNFYGGLPASYLHLVSRSIDILHPVTNQPLKLHAPRELLPPWVAYDDSVLQS